MTPRHARTCCARCGATLLQSQTEHQKGVRTRCQHGEKTTSEGARRNTATCEVLQTCEEQGLQQGVGEGPRQSHTHLRDGWAPTQRRARARPVRTGAALRGGGGHQRQRPHCHTPPRGDRAYQTPPQGGRACADGPSASSAWGGGGLEEKRGTLVPWGTRGIFKAMFYYVQVIIQLLLEALEK